MAGPSAAKIVADFKILKKSYPMNKDKSHVVMKLFIPWQERVKKENEAIAKRNEAHRAAKEKEEKLVPMPTPCCYQVSHALNALKDPAHAIPSNGMWRDYKPIPGGNGNYIGAVNELEDHLTKRYGAGQDFSIVGDAQKRLAYLKKYKKNGLILMRDASAGLHTEFWDGMAGKVLQSDTGLANISQLGVLSAKRVVYWPIVGKLMPDWLKGWWDVNDGDQYYYCFSDEEVCWYTTNRPMSPFDLPFGSEGNRGFVDVSDVAPHVTVTWNKLSPDQPINTIEKFTRIPVTIPQMVGASNRFGMLNARKIIW